MNIETFNAKSARECMTKSSDTELADVLNAIKSVADQGVDFLIWHTYLREDTRHKLLAKDFTVVNVSGSFAEGDINLGPYKISW